MERGEREVPGNGAGRGAPHPGLQQCRERVRGARCCGERGGERGPMVQRFWVCGTGGRGAEADVRGAEVQMSEAQVQRCRCSGFTGAGVQGAGAEGQRFAVQGAEMQMLRVRRCRYSGCRCARYKVQMCADVHSTEPELSPPLPPSLLSLLPHGPNTEQWHRFLLQVPSPVPCPCPSPVTVTALPAHAGDTGGAGTVAVSAAVTGGWAQPLAPAAPPSKPFPP